MNNVFGLSLTFVTWDSKVTSTHRPFWEHQSDEHFILADLGHMEFYTYKFYFVLAAIRTERPLKLRP